MKQNRSALLTLHPGGVSNVRTRERIRSSEDAGEAGKGHGANGEGNGVSGQEARQASRQIEPNPPSVGRETSIRARWIWLMVADLVPELMASKIPEKSQELVVEMVKRAKVPWPQIIDAIGKVERENCQTWH